MLPLRGSARNLVVSSGDDGRTWAVIADLALALLLVLLLFVIAQFLYYDQAQVIEEVDRRRGIVEAEIREAAMSALGREIELEVIPEGFTRQRVIFPEAMLFVPCGVDPQPEGVTLIQAVGAALRDRDGWFDAIQVEGHADRVIPTGDCARRVGDNWGLSSMRATAFLRVLVSDVGLGANQFVSATGRGDTNPRTPPDTSRDELEPDRRVELVLVFDEESARRGLSQGNATP